MIAGPKILGNATSVLVSGLAATAAGTGTVDFGRISAILMFVLALYVISTLFSYIQGFIMANISMKITYDFRQRISRKINTLPFNYYDQTTHGDILSRITNDVDTVSQTLSQGLTQIITSFTSIVGVLIMMLTISWQLTLIALLMVPFSMGLMVFIIKSSQKYFKQQQEYLGDMGGHVEEMYGGHTVMKAFNGENDSIAKFDLHNKKLYGSAWKSQFLTSIIFPLMNIIGNLGYVGICVAGGYMASSGSILIGDIQAFIQYVRSFNQPITQIANASNVIQQTAAAAERVFEFLDCPDEIPDGDDAAPVSPDQFTGMIEFKNVKFGYNPDTVVINNFSAVIAPGQKVAIVGPTGAGKTTIVKLLMRFYEIDGGQILIDGRDIKSMSRKDLRSLFGMVLQDTWLYNDTIMENIRYGKRKAADVDVVQAAKAARAHHFIMTMPDGYRIVMNEESDNISQGQKQLLTIARAILTDPKMLILDEATSSVDTKTEIDIQKAMDSLMKGRTSFVIAHRLSTIRNADLILVMNGGDIVEQGRHDDLLKSGGFYAELYNSQFDLSA